MKNKFYYKEKRVSCKKCGKYFRNRYVYAGHSKIHDKRALEKIANSRLGNLNPAKRLEVRKKISLAGIGRIPWNKKKIIKAFELNPGSVISKGLRAKEKGYDFLIVKIRRNPKYCHKNTDKEIPIKEF